MYLCSISAVCKSLITINNNERYYLLEIDNTSFILLYDKDNNNLEISKEYDILVPKKATYISKEYFTPLIYNYNIFKLFSNHCMEAYYDDNDKYRAFTVTIDKLFIDMIGVFIHKN